MKNTKKESESIGIIEMIVGFLSFWFILYQIIILILQLLNIAPLYGLSVFLGIALIFFALSGSGTCWYYTYYGQFRRSDYWSKWR